MKLLGARRIYASPSPQLIQALAYRGLIMFRPEIPTYQPNLYAITPPGRKAQRMGLETYLAHEEEIEGEGWPIEFNWSLIDDETEHVARSLFQNGHHAEAVSACAKHINTIVKAAFRIATGMEGDGAGLMSKALGISTGTGKAAVQLNDLLTETDRNVQEGYMHLCMGIMKAARNPLAHENVWMSANEAWQIITICSHITLVLKAARRQRTAG